MMPDALGDSLVGGMTDLDWLRAQALERPQPAAMPSSLAGVFGMPTWLQRATDQTQKDIAAYQQGGPAEMMQDTATAQDLAGGFGGNVKGVKAPIRGRVPASVAETAAATTEPKFFDYSRLNEVPDVPQVNLPRYEPPRGVPARTQELIANPDVRQKMLDLIGRGEEMGATTFYNADPLRQSFVEELGKRQGVPAFNQYMDFVAATSPRSEVGVNARNASYYYGLARRGEPMPEVGTRNPEPYGHLAQRLHQQNAQAVKGAGWNPLQNPKPASFSQNLSGNFEPGTIDTHAFRAPAMLAEDPRFLAQSFLLEKGAKPRNIRREFEQGKVSMEEALQRPAFWESMPLKTEYGAMEKYYQDLAREMQMRTAQAQAGGWGAGGAMTGLKSEASKPFLGFIEDRLRKTAEERGISMSEALSQMIRGKAPLLSVGGAAAAPALLRDQEQPVY